MSSPDDDATIMVIDNLQEVTSKTGYVVVATERSST